jgi:hypothetical protein
MRFKSSRRSPQSTRGTHMQISVLDPRIPQPRTRGTSIGEALTGPPVNLHDRNFLSSWLVNDSSQNSLVRAQKRCQGPLNWNRVLGLALLVGVGAGFWTAIGLAVAHTW